MRFTQFYQMLSCHSILLCKIDVIGAVTMISDVATIRTKMRQTQTAKRSVTIQNERLVTYLCSKLFYP